MAEHGIAGNNTLAAPFAYRPAVPMLVSGIDTIFRLEPVDGFSLLTTASAFLLLLSSFLFVRSIGGDFTPALSAMGLVAVSFYHIKYPLFFTTMIDIEAFVMMLLALWALFKKRFLLCLVISAVGVFVKEWLLIPAILLSFVLLNEFRLDRRRSSLLYAMMTILIVGTCFALPRILIPIPDVRDFQEFHKAPAAIRWSVNLRMPFNIYKAVNILFSLMSYWLPTFLLMTRERTTYAWNKLKNIRGVLYLYVSLVLLFAIYGGTNIAIFVAYTFVAQVLVLSTFVEHGISVWEAVAAFGMVVAFNRLFAHIPSLTNDFFGNVELYGGWSTLITWNTLYRFLELVGYVATMNVLRRFLGYYREERMANHGHIPRASINPV